MRWGGGCQIKRLEVGSTRLPFPQCVRAFTLRLSSHSASAAAWSSAARGAPPSQRGRYSLMTEIQLLGVGVVIDEKAALDGV